MLSLMTTEPPATDSTTGGSGLAGIPGRKRKIWGGRKGKGEKREGSHNKKQMRGR